MLPSGGPIPNLVLPHHSCPMSSRSRVAWQEKRRRKRERNQTDKAKNVVAQMKENRTDLPGFPGNKGARERLWQANEMHVYL